VNDPIAMLKRDHREVEQMLTKLQGSKSAARRRSTVEKLVKELNLHMDLEEQMIYPLVAQELGAPKAEEAEIEHRLTREGIAHLQEMVDQPGFGAVVEMLRAGIKHHVKEEEREILPKLKRKMDRAQLAELGEQAMQMKIERGSSVRPAASRNGARRSRAGGGRSRTASPRTRAAARS
jgi:hemerythrin-like domain-containing protein